jgi:outer membrane receptor protein involved in Fe transport
MPHSGAPNMGEGGGEGTRRAQSHPPGVFISYASRTRHRRSVVNASLGLRAGARWEVSVWARNLFNRDYMQNLTIQAGNSGLVVGTPSDPRIVGVAVRASF